MSYINARHVLPPELVAAIQEHVDGCLIYIPRQSDKRQAWGCLSGGRAALDQRNQSIRQDYRYGRSLAELAESRHLSEDSVRKIIQGTRRSEPSEPAAGRRL
jgi:Mor family transcriptional regulator